MAKQALPVKHRTRVLFVAGHLRPRREPRPCSDFGHAGPLDDCDRFDAAGGVWRGMGNCRACGSTISRSQLLRAA